MTVKAQTMTEGRLLGQIIKFSLPLVATNLLQMLFSVSDLVIVGRFGEEGALGAVGSTTLLIMIFTGFLIGLSGGVNVLVARYFGARNIDKMRKAEHTGVMISAVLGVSLAVVGILLVRPILTLLNTKPELIDDAVLYLRIYFLSLPAVALYNCGKAVLNASGDTKRPLYFLLVSGSMNVALNLLFVICFRMNVAGVALASVIAQYVSATLVMATLIRSDGDIRLNIAELSFDSRMTSSLLLLGIPAGFQNAIFYIANLFVQVGINSFSATVVSGVAAAVNSDNVLFAVMDAIYVACASFVSQNYGAAKPDRIIKTYLFCQGLLIVASVVGGALLLCFDMEFLLIFTSDTEVAKAGIDRLTVLAASYWIATFMDNAIAAARGLGKSIIPTIIIFGGSCLFRIVWIYSIFAHYRTVFSLFMLYPFSWTITAVAAIIYFMYCFQKVKKSICLNTGAKI